MYFSNPYAKITSNDSGWRHLGAIWSALDDDPAENRQSRYRIIASPHPWDCMFHVLAAWRAGQIAVLAGGADQGIRAVGGADYCVAHDVDIPTNDTPFKLTMDEVVFPGPSDAPAAVVMSSGSTGEPKGILLTRKAITSSCDMLIDVFKMIPKESYGNLSPVHSMGGLRAFMLALRYGNDIQFLGDATESGLAYADKVLSSGVSVCLSGASFVRLLDASRRWLAQKPTRLRAIMSCGSLYDDQASIAVQRAYGINVVNAYGQTETTGIVMSENLGVYRHNRMAPPLVNIRQHFRPHGAGIDELGIETPYGFAGYLGRPPHCDKIIWTGDLVRRHEDGVEFVGRASHSVKSACGGHWLFPDRVEIWIRANTDISDVVVRPSENQAGLIGALHAKSVPADLLPRICAALGPQYATLKLHAGRVERTPAGKLLQLVFEPEARGVSA